MERHCPFCGVGPKDFDEDGPFLHVNETEEEWFYVKCGNCGARSGKASTPKAASDKWDERIDE
jgi:hypothetical protein